MNNLPDFTPYGYRLLEILSNNIVGGRITYKAVQLSTNDYVIIKQFQFASSKNWHIYKQVEREINVLQGLDNIGIPNYIETIDHSDGLCFVQQYINAPNLSISRSFNTKQIKSIATQLLEILVYLQSRVPAIIHRDIKPENVLYDAKNDRVYLVDFGLARIGTNESALSSMVAGTPGFMPPEQLLGKDLSKASDLYSLGATIICLVTGTISTELNKIIDSNFTINFQSKVSQYNQRFINWLERMVKPEINKRFTNAKEALDELNGIDDLVRIPEVKIDNSELVFIAKKYGQRLTQIITITNTIPNTILKGKWSVYPNQNDPPHTPDNHAFISFSPKEFEGNNSQCKVTVDTSKLKSNQRGERTIIFKSNAGLKDYPIKVKIDTKPLSEQKKNTGWYWLFLGAFCIIGIALGGFSFILPITGAITGAISGAISGAITGAISGAISWAILVPMLRAMPETFEIPWENYRATSWANYGAISGAMLGAMAVTEANYRAILGAISGAMLGAISGAIGGAIFGAISGAISGAKTGAKTGGFEGAFEGAMLGAIGGAFEGAFEGAKLGAIFGVISGPIFVAIQYPEAILGAISGVISGAILAMKKQGFNYIMIYISIFLTLISGASMGWLHLVGINIYAILSLAASSVPLASMLIYPQIQHRNLIARYRREEQNLIEL